MAIGACADPPVCDTSAVIVDPSGTSAPKVFTMTDPNDLFTNCVVWSPDASRLACEGDGQSDPGLNGIYTISATDGSDLRRLTTNAGGIDHPIDYSPDGRQIVISRTDPSRPSTSNSALFVINADGNNPHRITPWGFNDDDGSWSPDGTQIAFEHHGKIFTIHPDGTGLTELQLAVPGGYFAGDTSWSPDGTRILFLLGGNNRPEGIATANRDGSDVRQVTVSPTFDHMGDWG